MPTSLFESIVLWKNVNETTAIKYCCLKDISLNKFAVQSADFFHLPVDENQLKKSEKQFIELFIETNPLNRCDWFFTLNEAVNQFDNDFS
ncbi:hypothetical protein [Janthinobacterium sp. B9-8]|uniref:hypothetical protein n=1 Tax=Janthinobacterium sp. B9-8 TaxID=1236179 RepID=UPI00061D27E5|nr:hypothetical protein [Janthinobacterium sp. B9-8]AMC33234.1 hypothetical protein VN23_00665 [Janthinobacterium sp. B9-8]